MPTDLTQAIEDYLKVIYGLTRSAERASTNQIAERMGVTAASVTGMLQRMAAAEPSLVDYQKHHGALLTLAGEQAALEIIRHHRLLELFLHQALGYSWDEVHGEADRLEHVISEEFEERMAQALGNPSHDPHGEPIPTRDLRLPVHTSQVLSSLQVGQVARIQQVDAANPDLLRYLGTLGLVPGAEVEVLEVSPYDHNLRLQVSGQPQPVVLGPAVTSGILVDVGDRSPQEGLSQKRAE